MAREPDRFRPRFCLPGEDCGRYDSCAAMARANRCVPDGTADRAVEVIPNHVTSSDVVYLRFISQNF